jgi:exodeoxyribonuclease VII large subunit
VQVDARLVEALTRRQVEGRRAVASLTARLEALSPLAVLTRGYAIARHEGKPVLDAAALHPGDTLEVRLARGSVQARVEAIASS